MSSDWKILFNQAGVIHLSPTGSDHLPLQLTLYQDHPYTPQLFCFMKAWIKDPTCGLVIQEAWFCNDSNSRRNSLSARINRTAKALKQWNKESFGFCHFKIKMLKNQLFHFFNFPPSKENLNAQQIIQSDIDEWKLSLELI